MKKLILILCTATLFACSNDEDLTTPSSSENKQLIGNTYEEQSSIKSIWKFSKDSIAMLRIDKTINRKYTIENDTLTIIFEGDPFSAGRIVIDEFGFKLYDEKVRTFIKL